MAPLAPAAYDLCTVADVQRRLGGDWSKADPAVVDAIQDIVSGISAVFLSETGRYLLKRTYTGEVYDGRGETKIFLKQAPIISVATLQIGNFTVVQATNSESPGFLIDADNGALVLTRFSTPDRFPPSRMSVTVSYVAGFDPLSLNPAYAAEANDCRTLCIRQAVHEYQRRQGEGKRSEGLGGQTLSFVVDDFLPPVARFIVRKKRWRF